MKVAIGLMVWVCVVGFQSRHRFFQCASRCCFRGGPPVVVVGFKESLVWSACAYGSVIFGFGVIPAQITQ